MIALLRRLDKNVSIKAELDVEVDSLPFHFKIEENVALIEFAHWRDGLALSKAFTIDSGSLKKNVRELDDELKRLDITIAIRKPGLAVLGSRANPFYGFLLKNLLPVLIR